MAPRGLFRLVDPTFLFLFPSLMLGLFVKVDEEQRQVSPVIPAFSDVFAYLADPALLLGVTVFAVAMSCVWGGTRQLGFGESLAANWYLWNCVFVHVMLDGLAGGYGMLGPMGDYYKILDKRFRYHMVGKPGGPVAADSAIVWLLCRIELFCHAPLTFFAFVGVARRAPWRQTIEAVALSLQFFGSLIFPAGDLLTDCSNMQPIDVPTCFPPVTAFNVLFYYFPTSINFVWCFVPMFMLVQVVRSDVSEKRGMSQQKTK